MFIQCHRQRILPRLHHDTTCIPTGLWTTSLKQFANLSHLVRLNTPTPSLIHVMQIVNLLTHVMQTVTWTLVSPAVD